MLLLEIDRVPYDDTNLDVLVGICFPNWCIDKKTSSVRWKHVSPFIVSICALNHCPMVFYFSWIVWFHTFMELFSGFKAGRLYDIIFDLFGPTTNSMRRMATLVSGDRMMELALRSGNSITCMVCLRGKLNYTFNFKWNAVAISLSLSTPPPLLLLMNIQQGHIQSLLVCINILCCFVPS